MTALLEYLDLFIDRLSNHQKLLVLLFGLLSNSTTSLLYTQIRKYN